MSARNSIVAISPFNVAIASLSPIGMDGATKLSISENARIYAIQKRDEPDETI